MKRTIQPLLVSFISAAIFLTGCSSQIPEDSTSKPKTTQKIAADALSATVSVGASNTVTANGATIVTSIVAAGWFIDNDCHIIAASHVADSSYKDITIELADRTTRPVKIVFEDKETDIAVLAAEECGVHGVLEWGDSSKLEVGDTVLEVGNPLRVGLSVTRGIISALGRKPQEGFPGFIQYDAATNPGNSGGPVIDRNGEVIGMANSTLVPGVSYATPSRYILEQLPKEFLPKGYQPAHSIYTSKKSAASIEPH